MVGDGVLHDCLEDPRVASVLCIGRSPLGITHPKLREIRRLDFLDYRDLMRELESVDACFFCLGVSSVGMSEAEYSRQTFDLTLAAGRALAAAHPGATFCYVSGQGTDSSERGRVMWARVKGKTENALLRLPFKAAYMFRPGVIEPLHGLQSRTALYRIPYLLLRPLFPWLRRRFPQYITTTEQLGRAMIVAARHGAPKTVLES